VLIYLRLRSPWRSVSKCKVDIVEWNIRARHVTDIAPDRSAPVLWVIDMIACRVNHNTEVRAEHTVIEEGGDDSAYR
jgi:hypothetical protein